MKSICWSKWTILEEVLVRVEPFILGFSNFSTKSMMLKFQLDIWIPTPQRASFSRKKFVYVLQNSLKLNSRLQIGGQLLQKHPKFPSLDWSAQILWNQWNGSTPQLKLMPLVCEPMIEFWWIVCQNYCASTCWPREWWWVGIWRILFGNVYQTAN